MKTFQFENTHNSSMITIWAETEELATLIMQEELMNPVDYVFLGELTDDLSIE